jgi:hypothetical protein
MTDWPGATAASTPAALGVAAKNAFSAICPGRKPPFLAVKRPVHPYNIYKSPIQN